MAGRQGRDRFARTVDRFYPAAAAAELHDEAAPQRMGAREMPRGGAGEAELRAQVPPRLPPPAQWSLPRRAARRIGCRELGGQVADAEREQRVVEVDDKAARWARAKAVADGLSAHGEERVVAERNVGAAAAAWARAEERAGRAAHAAAADAWGQFGPSLGVAAAAPSAVRPARNAG
jgi:hypothetical protein